MDETWISAPTTDVEGDQYSINEFHRGLFLFSGNVYGKKKMVEKILKSNNYIALLAVCIDMVKKSL